MRLSVQGVKFIEKSEGLKRGSYFNHMHHAYWDQFGKVWTIAWGLTHDAEGRAVTEHTAWNDAEADRNFAAVLEQYSANTDRIIDKSLLEPKRHEFDALVSFCYNCGAGNLKRLVSDLELCGNDPSLVSEAFMRYVYAKGKVVEGLKNRRRHEKDLYLNAKYDFS